MELEWGRIVNTVNLTFIINIIQFLILVWILNRILYRPVLRFINKRRGKIENLEEQAKKFRNEAQSLNKKRHNLLEEARKKHRDILEGARREGEQIKQEKLKEAKQEARKIIERAEAELEAEEDIIRQQIQKEIRKNALLSASKILGREVS